METLGERLNMARKSRGYTQESLAAAIGVSRGVIFNLEKGKTEPQAIVVNALCRALDIRRDWLLSGEGPMEDSGEAPESARILAELHELAGALSRDEQLYLLDTVKALKNRLGRAEYAE